MGPRGRFYSYLYHCDYVGLLGTDFMQVMYLGRAARTKETLPDFLKWRLVTRHPLVFRGLTGSQRTPGFGASQEPLGKDRSSYIPLIKSQSKHMILGSWKAHIRTPTSNTYTQNNDPHKSIYVLKEYLY